MEVGLTMMFTTPVRSLCSILSCLFLMRMTWLIVILPVFFMMEYNHLNISCVTFNAHGMKSSLPYVLDLAKQHDIVFINEHWLKESDFYTVTDICSETKIWCHLQSGMDPDVDLSGRPYGGVSFLCRRSEDLAYKVMDPLSKRVLGLHVLNDNKVVLNIIGVYLPCNDSKPETMELYIQCLDQIQSVIDNCANNAPFIIMGDFNTTLPDEDTLKENWFCNKPYKPRSAVLYELISSNEMCVANFLFQQDVSHTFSSVNGSSYIDHIIIPTYMCDRVLSCEILHSNSDNTSDHCPVRVDLDIRVDHTVSSSNKNPTNPLPFFPRPRWHDCDFQKLYEIKPYVKFHWTSQKIHRIMERKNL